MYDVLSKDSLSWVTVTLKNTNNEALGAGRSGLYAPILME